MLKPRFHSRPAVLLLEALVAISLIILLTGTMAWALAEYSTHSQILRTRARAAAAAECVLNEIRAGIPEDAAAFRERFAGLTADVQRAPGDGDWVGMTLVTVRVAAASDAEARPKPLAELSGYIAEAAK